MQVELRAEKMEKLRQKLEELMQQVRDLGRYPKHSKRDVVEMELAEKLRRARKAKQFSPEQEAELQARKLQERARVVQSLVDAIIELGYLPTKSKNSSVQEKRLAARLSNTLLSSEQEAALGHLAYGAAEVRAASGEHLWQQVGDLDCYPKASKPGRPRLAENLRNTWQARKFQQRAAARIAKAEEIMQEVRGFGRYPMVSRQDVRGRQLADKLRKARKAKRFSPAQEAELQVLQQAARDARAEARSAYRRESPRRSSRPRRLMQQAREVPGHPAGQG